MADEGRDDLLTTDDPAPVACTNAQAPSPFLLTGDHAGSAIPARLGSLGLERGERERHIALDIGVASLGERLAAQLDAVFLAQRYSRLVIDCNRDPRSEEAIPAVSDGTPIPGNNALTQAARAARIAAIHEPYHQRIAAEIAQRSARGQQTVLVALHSFTPVLAGVRRPWDIGVLHGEGDVRFARRLLGVLSREPDVIVGDNEPYRFDATDHSVPRHAFKAELAYAEIEVRQDLIADSRGQQRWADRLAEAFSQALAECAGLAE